tara:strand:- start:3969 stop:4280 length:312 start_codon:yes stop_codon:yes gene_type:complete
MVNVVRTLPKTLMLDIEMSRERLVRDTDIYKRVKYGGLVPIAKQILKTEEDYNRALRTLHNLNQPLTKEYVDEISSRIKEREKKIEDGSFKALLDHELTFYAK